MYTHQGCGLPKKILFGWNSTTTLGPTDWPRKHLDVISRSTCSRGGGSGCRLIMGEWSSTVEWKYVTPTISNYLDEQNITIAWCFCISNDLFHIHVAVLLLFHAVITYLPPCSPRDTVTHFPSSVSSTPPGVCNQDALLDLIGHSALCHTCYRPYRDRCCWEKSQSGIQINNLWSESSWVTGRASIMRSETRRATRRHVG